MAEETITGTQETQEEIKNKVEERIKELSGKVKLTAKERDELAEANRALNAEKESLAKEVSFYKDFSKTSTRFPQASEYQDKILEKVKGGYTVEDATVSVLNAEGRLTTPKPDMTTAAGGSATTTPTQTGAKAPGEMTQAERRKFLEENLIIQ